KPFARVNGSGKHVNWSLSADGENLLEPGDDPGKNLQFLTFLVACVRAAYLYAPVLRASVAYAANDHRLGGHEAPPAIFSVFLGRQLTYVLQMIEDGQVQPKKIDETINLGISSIPKIPRDNTDRNRTSPFAFTGNKFEFRAVGSSQSVAIPVTVLNTSVSESIDFLCRKIRDKTGEGFALFEAVIAVLKEVIPTVRPILFEGDNYSDEWQKEAQKRGLLNLRTAPEALKAYALPECRKMLIESGVFSESELSARYQVEMEKYCKTLQIEGQMALEVARTSILPVAVRHLGRLGKTISSLGGKDKAGLLAGTAEKLLSMINELITCIDSLEIALGETAGLSLEEAADSNRVKVLPEMNRLRKAADALETVVDDDLWSLPKYYELLFYD
ncbi:MAG: glutamine synthetase type III, partial [Candidatus Wallbacteria bacterium]|nr:glutamine synthetase type III [Candidatus Wallbacteria bacterium]